MATTVVGLLRLASIAICLIVIASFGVFAVEQTKGGSQHQQEELAVAPGTTGDPQGAPAPSAQSAKREGTVHKGLTEASSALTSPFSGIVSGSSEWATRGAKLALALLVYGFGLGYLVRVIRVRV